MREIKIFSILLLFHSSNQMNHLGLASHLHQISLIPNPDPLLLLLLLLPKHLPPFFLTKYLPPLLLPLLSLLPLHLPMLLLLPLLLLLLLLPPLLLLILLILSFTAVASSIVWFFVLPIGFDFRFGLMGLSCHWI